MRETRLISTLHHENIVNYHSSWLEFNLLSKTPGEFDEEEYENDEFDDYSIDESKAKHKNFDDSTSATASGKNKFFREPSLAATSFSATNENETTTNNHNHIDNNKKSIENDESSVFSKKSKRAQNKTNHHQSNNDFIFTLYIQMRLCDFTLKHYINKRNGDVNMCSIENKNNFFKENDKLYSDIFRQILCGVNYMHSKSIIHRDLKVKF